MTATPQMAAPEAGLKRLGLVRSLTQQAFGYVAPVASTAVGYGDSALASLGLGGGKANLLSSTAAPWVSRAQDLGDSALKAVDGQVDYALNTSTAALSTGRQTVGDSVEGLRQIHSTNSAALKAAFQSYITRLQRGSDWATQHLNPVRASRATVEWTQESLARAQELADPDVLAGWAQDRWAYVSGIPVVRAVLDTAQPVTNAGKSVFYSAHDITVGSGVYKYAVDTSASTWGWATSTFPYRLSAQYLYPLVQPVAEPTLDKITKSKVVNSTVEFWKPSVAAAAS